MDVWEGDQKWKLKLGGGGERNVEELIWRGTNKTKGHMPGFIGKPNTIETS